MNFATLLALAASASAPAAQLPRPAPMAQARASVRIVKARRIELARIARERPSDVTVRRDKAGTTWIEFR